MSFLKRRDIKVAAISLSLFPVIKLALRKPTRFSLSLLYPSKNSENIPSFDPY